MGLSVTASHVIWFFAFVGLAGGVLTAFFDLSGTFRHAEATRQAIDSEKLHAFLANATFCYDGAAQEVRVNATNEGAAALDVGNLTFVLDGAPASGFAATPQDGVATSFWAPGEWMAFTETGVAREPSTLVIATEHGVLVRATKTACP